MYLHAVVFSLPLSRGILSPIQRRPRLRVVGKPTIIMRMRVVGALNMSQLEGFPAVGQTHIACECTKKNRYLAYCSYFEIKTGMRFMHEIS